MKMILQRYSTTTNITKGHLYIEGVHICDVLEDIFRAKKVLGETRIPAGTYEVVLYTAGSLHTKYKTRFPDMHEGMLLLKGVPGYEGVCIHVGNTKADTLGCLIVGNILPANEDRISDSQTAYVKLYLKVLEFLKRPVKVYLTVQDENIIFGSK